MIVECGPRIEAAAPTGNLRVTNHTAWAFGVSKQHWVVRRPASVIGGSAQVLSDTLPGKPGESSVAASTTFGALRAPLRGQGLTLTNNYNNPYITIALFEAK